MDDSNSSQGIDLNPDMMTTQSGIPTVIPRASSTYPSLPRPGIIDITPGAPEPSTVTSPSQHIDISDMPADKVIDITPEGPVSPDLIEDDFVSTPHLSDIVPQSQDDALSDINSPEPISEILTKTTPDTLPTAPPSDETSLEELPKITEVTQVSEPITTDTTTQAEATIIEAQTQATPTKEELATLNPLYEDPEQVKLAK